MSTKLTIGTLFLLILSLMMTGCLSGKSGSSGNGSNNGNGSLTSITVTPAGSKVAPGDSKQFKAMGHFDDGSNRDITSTATWSSSNHAIATIDQTGLALAVDSGSATITATSNGINGSTSLNVANLSNVSIVPLNKKIDPTQTQQFQCFANYDNNENRDVTSQATWTSSDPSVATIDATGLATAVAAGNTTITAAFKGDQATTTLTVNQLVSITLSPIGPAIQVPGTQQFKATGHFGDNSVLDVTNLASWTSDTLPVATVNDSDHKGLATSVAIGQTEISATWLGITGSTAMDVTSLTFSNADLTGDYIIFLTGVDSRGAYFLVGTLHADGVGGITGTMDTNTKQGVNLKQTVQGKYTVFPDGRGDLQLFGASAGTSTGHTLRFVFTANKNSAELTEFQTTTVTSGRLEKQTDGLGTAKSCSSFLATDFQGDYAFGQGGLIPGGTTTVLAGVGSFNASGSNITGQEDTNDGTTHSQVTLTSANLTQDSTVKCRFTASLNDGTHTSQFVYYLVAPGTTNGRAYLMSAGSGSIGTSVQAGLAEQQTTTTVSDNVYVFLTDQGGTAGEFHIAGQIALSAGNITGGEQDEAPIANPPVAVSVTGGSYVAGGAGGRYTLGETTSSGSNPNFVLYTVSATRFFMLRSDTGAGKVAMGSADVQTSLAQPSGNFGLGAAALNSVASAQADGGLLYIPQGSCAICGIGDRNSAGTVSSLTLSNGSFSIAPDAFGRGEISLDEPGSVTRKYIFYAISTNRFVIFGEDPNTDGILEKQ